MPVIRPKRPIPPFTPEPQPDSSTEPSPTPSPSPTPADSPVGIPALAQLIGKAIAHAHLYGPDHSVTAATTDQAFVMLEKILSDKEKLDLHVADGNLFADGEAVEMKNPLMGTFAQALASLNVSSVTLEKGMTRDEFAEFATVLACGKAQAGRKPVDPGNEDDSAPDNLTLDESRFSHLKTRKTVYRAVTEDEVVVSRDDAEKTETLQGFQGAHVQQIVAFLKGHTDAVPSDNPLADLENTATHADQLADLIMKSAVIDRQAADIEGGDTLGNIVVGCLRRTFDAMNRTPGAHTRKGKRAIKKTLTILEKDILDRLRETAQEGFETAIEAVSQTVADMTEEVQASDLAAQYVKKRRAAGEDEERLLRFIRKQGSRAIEDPALLKNQLVGEGLSEEGWQELVVRSGIGPAAAASEDVSESAPDGGRAGSDISNDTRDVSTLISLLDDLTSAVKKDPSDTADGGLMKVLEKVGREVDAAIASTDEKVEALARFAEILAQEDVGRDTLSAPDPATESARSNAVEGRSKRLTSVQQRSVMRILGEITQELSQPLSVIGCTLDMLRNMDAENLNQSKEPLIDLARESVARMDDLIQKVARVTGLPKEMYPDHALLDLLDAVPPTQGQE